MEVPIEQARWRRSQIAETLASLRASAPCYRLPKDVLFVAILVVGCGRLTTRQCEVLFLSSSEGASGVAAVSSARSEDAASREDAKDQNEQRRPSGTY